MRLQPVLYQLLRQVSHSLPRRRQTLIAVNLDLSCQAKFTLWTGDTAIKPNGWVDLFACWGRRCAAVISSKSMTIPTPTPTVSPSEKSKAPVASCDPEGAADRFAFCTHAQLSASACFGVTFTRHTP
jgi:hypothetical protein